jgi:uncharacterized protein (TIGR02679 family)
MPVVSPGLADPALARLWDAVAERLQRNGMTPRGLVILEDLEREERYALAGLLGRPVTASRVRVDLRVLDDRLRQSGAVPGLVAAATGLRGPLTDRRGVRVERATSRDAVWASLRAELAALGLDGESWCEPWVDALRPLVARSAPDRAVGALLLAARCLHRIGTEAGTGTIGRSELAAAVAGDSHALDDDSLLCTMVLRGLAAQQGVPEPDGAEGRRRLWGLAGVLCDEVSTTVLTYGLHPAEPEASAAARSLSSRSSGGLESHLSLRDLRRLGRLVAPGGIVFVCENPRVLEAAMEAASPRAIVCSSGNPTVVVTLLLERLAEGGAELRYRGDFDWPGIAIANRVVERFGAAAWRMGADDYERALADAGASLVELPRLSGRLVEASWDPLLAAAMERAGRVVHEERLLGTLVDDLSS